MISQGIDDIDYLRAYMSEPEIDPAKAALIVVDMRDTTGHRDGALGRRMASERSNTTTASIESQSRWYPIPHGARPDPRGGPQTFFLNEHGRRPSHNYVRAVFAQSTFISASQ